MGRCECFSFIRTFQNRTLRPIWLDMSWQALWNWNDHMQGHGIDLHSDASRTYRSLDPILSLSFGRGGVLTLGTHKGRAPSKMLFQEGGDVLVMAGDFQSEFVHGVPTRSSWSHLRNLPMFTGMNQWEKLGLDKEIELHETAVPGAQHVRMNCTIRWHSTHNPQCPMHVGHAAQGSGTQPVFTGAVRTNAECVDPWAVDEPLQSDVSEVSAVKFVAIKRAGVTEAGQARLLDRAVQTDGLCDIVQTLLACIDQCAQQSELFRLVLHSIPLVEATATHAETLMRIEGTVRHLRRQLVVASEAVEELASGRDYKVEYNCLNLMGLAAAQRGEMHTQFGRLRTAEGSWLVETVPNKPHQNCLNKDVLYWKCLLSHHQLELMLEVLSESKMIEHGEIAFDLAQLPDGSLLQQLTCAKRSHHQAKQHQNDDLGFDTYVVPTGSVLLMKALEIGYVKESDKSRRLQTSQYLWKKLLEVRSGSEIVDSLQQGVRTALQHLRTLDVDRDLCDRTSEGALNEQYDIWVWLWHVQEKKPAAAKATSKPTRRLG